MFKYALGILTSPHSTWKAVANEAPDSGDRGLIFPAIFALVPCVFWFYGVTNVGWTVGDGEITRLTTDSAMMMIIAFYFAMVGSLVTIGWFIHWMSATYGAESTLTKGIRLAALCSTPLFLSGVVGIYPNILLDMSVGVIMVSWATYLLYVGIPIVMNIPEERGFLFASAVLAVCLVMLVVIMTVSIILWDYGFHPAFTD